MAPGVQRRPAAMQATDPDGCCVICLSAWDTEKQIIVPAACGHALHVDCFCQLIMKPCSQAYRGSCRTCRRQHYYPPLTRAHLYCTLGGVVAKGFRVSLRQSLCVECGPGGRLDREDIQMIADLCLSIAEEVDGPVSRWDSSLVAANGPTLVWKQICSELARLSNDSNQQPVPCPEIVTVVCQEIRARCSF